MRNLGRQILFLLFFFFFFAFFFHITQRYMKDSLVRYQTPESDFFDSNFNNVLNFDKKSVENRRIYQPEQNFLERNQKLLPENLEYEQWLKNERQNEETTNAGLGMLYDGKTSFSSFNNESLPTLGAVWQGWNTELLSKRRLEILFYFDTMRNFSTFSFYSFAQDKSTFVLPTTATFLFSEDGVMYAKKSIQTKFKFSTPFVAGHQGRNVTINLQHRAGKIIKSVFDFPEERAVFLLGEVYFESEPCDCKLTDSKTNEASTPAERTGDDWSGDETSPILAVNPQTKTYMAVVIGFLSGVILLVVLALLVYAKKFYHKKYSSQVLKSPLSDTASMTFDLNSLRLATSYSGIGPSMYGAILGSEEHVSPYHEPFKSKSLKPSYENAQYGVTTIAKQFSEYTNISFEPNVRRKGTGDYAVPIISSISMPFNYDTLSLESKVKSQKRQQKTQNIQSSANLYNTNNNLEKNHYSSTKITSISTPFIAGNWNASEYESSDFCQHANDLGKNSTLPRGSSTSSLHDPIDIFSKQIGCNKEIGILSAFGTVLYEAKKESNLLSKLPRVIPKDIVQLAEKIGEGQFGSVYGGELVNRNTEEENRLTNKHPNGGRATPVSRKVTVAILNHDAPEEKKKETLDQAKLLASLQDPNLECLLGVVSEEKQLMFILEFPALGDLNQYLRKHVPDTTTPRLNHMRPISYGSLLNIACQISSAMKYLECQNIIHRDLSSRNIIVCPGQLVKVGSIGACRSLYSGDYFQISSDKSKLPIRWMSWEAIYQGDFSCSSDVWSFGVTFWEILTLCRQQPFEKLSDDAVIENISHFLHNHHNYVFLNQPTNCPKEIYDLMKACWKRDPKIRPKFSQIHHFLQRKNFGYSPEL